MMAECSSNLQAEKLRMLPREKMKTLISKLCEVKINAKMYIPTCTGMLDQATT